MRKGARGPRRDRRVGLDDRAGHQPEDEADLAKQGAADSLDEFRVYDEIGLWAFSTGIGPEIHPNYIELSPMVPRGDYTTRLRTLIVALQPTSGTPLYEITRQAYDAVDAGYDDSLINAVVLLSDGKESTQKPLADLRDYLQERSESVTSPSVRIFTIAYGKDADVNAMQQIAKATNGAYYDATDPSTIVDVLNAVISNF